MYVCAPLLANGRFDAVPPTENRHPNIIRNVFLLIKKQNNYTVIAAAADYMDTYDRSDKSCRSTNPSLALASGCFSHHPSEFGKMVNKCCVRGCPSRAGQNIKFHKFPKGDIGNQWVKFLKQYNPSFEKHVSSNVCGLHFDCNLDYEISSASVFNTKTLKKNAVPSIIFNTTTHKTLSHESNIVSGEEEIIPLSLVTNLYSKPLETPMSISAPSTSDVASQKANVVDPSQSVSPSTNIVEEQLSPVPQITNKKSYGKRKCFLGDFKSPNDLENPNNRLIYWYASQTAVIKQKKRLKFLKNQALQLKNQINALEKKADHLKTKNKLIMDVLGVSL